MGRSGKLVGGAREPARLAPLKSRRSRRVVMLPGSLVMHLAALKLDENTTATPTDLISDFVFNRNGAPLEHRECPSRSGAR